MIFGCLLVILAVMLILALMWKPSRNSSAPANAIQNAIASMSTPAPRRSDPLDDQIELIAEAIRESDKKRRKAQAMERLRELMVDE